MHQSITEITYNNGDGEEGYDQIKVGKNQTQVAFLVKHLNNFWRSLNISLINCEVEIILTWSQKFCFSLYDLLLKFHLHIKLVKHLKLNIM